jgi:hypothetical protein
LACTSSAKLSICTCLMFLTSLLCRLPPVPALSANRAITVFTQRRICAAFAAIVARGARSRILMIRHSLLDKPNSRWVSEPRIMRDSASKGGLCSPTSGRGLSAIRNFDHAGELRLPVNKGAEVVGIETEELSGTLGLGDHAARSPAEECGLAEESSR